MRKQRTWREKLADSKDLPKIKRVTGKMSQRWGGGRCLIPAPLDVDAVMKRVRKGKLITIDQIRQQLARGRDVDFTCPITTGIFAWIAAHAADEAERAGAKRVTPYWRTLKNGGELNPKYPGGIENVAARLRAEGHRVTQCGKRHFVAAYLHP
jgi:hypothetical protein